MALDICYRYGSREKAMLAQQPITIT